MVAGMLGLDLAALEQKLATDYVPQAAKVSTLFRMYWRVLQLF